MGLLIYIILKCKPLVDFVILCVNFWYYTKVKVNMEKWILKYIYIDQKIMELLKDPGNTRAYKGLPLPPHKPIKS
jgi:hypothetical protein